MIYTILCVLSSVISFFFVVTIPLWILATVRKNNQRIEAEEAERHAEHQKILDALSLVYDKLCALENAIKNKDRN